MLYDSANVLGGGLSSTSVVKKLYLIGQETKYNAHRYFEVMREGINPAFHAWVVVKGIAVEIAELRDVPF